MSDGQSDIAKRGMHLSMRVSNRSIEHNLSHDRYRRWSRVISVVGALLAATAGASLLAGLTGGWATAVAGMGFLSALLATIEPLLGYSKQAEAHRRAGSSFGALGTSYYNLQYLSDREQQLKALEELTLRQKELENESVGVEQWAVKEREKEERRKRQLEDSRQREHKGALA
ncbi:SLATT domain-containing protein [Streptomyces albipurpureus]|uniref:SLATT domain-containing protein n=1 Tax=Streptomyces albipurpureus TaxID=2897419 RepID=A0ABT0UNR6_9ACTN|nr:SLATT domain-containing protein [Streptomyces sp. CWNU-1]MCM2389735.1 SLATT domain-containing protein [Streptomyces sp. CWNU-1]